MAYVRVPPDELSQVTGRYPVVRVNRTTDAAYVVYYVSESDPWGVLATQESHDILVWVSEDYAYFPSLSLRHDPRLYRKLLERTLEVLGDDLRRPGYTPAPQHPEVMDLWQRYVATLRTLILRMEKENERCPENM